MRRKPRLLLDENIGRKVAEELRSKGVQVQSILEEARGSPDTAVIEKAKRDGKIIVTMDKDFGYLAQAYNIPGLVLLRLRDPRIPNRLRAILRALQVGELYGYITIVTESRIRRRPLSGNTLLEL